MFIESFNMNPLSNTPEEVETPIQINSREASEIALETLTALYVSIHARMTFNPYQEADTRILTQEQLSRNIPDQRKAAFLRNNGLELGEWASEKAALCQLKPFRIIGDPSGEFSPQRNHLAMITSTSIQDIYYGKEGETGIESRASLFTQGHRRSPRNALPAPSQTSLIELLESSIAITSLNLQKASSLETTALANWQWSHRRTDDDLDDLKVITANALFLTHHVLKTLKEKVSTPSENHRATTLINETFYAIHRMAIKIIHDKTINSSSPIDVDKTITQTIELLNDLVNDFEADCAYGNFMMFQMGMLPNR